MDFFDEIRKEIDDFEVKKTKISKLSNDIDSLVIKFNNELAEFENKILKLESNINDLSKNQDEQLNKIIDNSKNELDVLKGINNEQTNNIASKYSEIKKQINEFFDGQNSIIKDNAFKLELKYDELINKYNVFTSLINDLSKQLHNDILALDNKIERKIAEFEAEYTKKLDMIKESNVKLLRLLFVSTSFFGVVLLIFLIILLCR